MLTIDYARSLYPANADSAHDFDHVLRVAQLADTIAQAEGADREIVRVAALCGNQENEAMRIIPPTSMPPVSM